MLPIHSTDADVCSSLRNRECHAFRSGVDANKTKDYNLPSRNWVVASLFQTLPILIDRDLEVRTMSPSGTVAS